jgi:hypothetical protein
MEWGGDPGDWIGHLDLVTCLSALSSNSKHRHHMSQTMYKSTFADPPADSNREGFLRDWTGQFELGNCLLSVLLSNSKTATTISSRPPPRHPKCSLSCWASAHMMKYSCFLDPHATDERPPWAANHPSCRAGRGLPRDPVEQ